MRIAFSVLRVGTLRLVAALVLCVSLAGPLLAQGGGTITTVAGNGAAAFAGDGGPATAASLNNPVSIAFAPDGGYYIADFLNHRVRRVAADGTITTAAGNGVKGYNGDGGPAINASLNDPTGVAVDSQGNLYVADAANDRIRKVDGNGMITTIAGTGAGGFGGDGGPATAAMLDCPTRIAFDAFGSLFVADQCNHRIRKIDTNGMINTVAGSGNAGAPFGGFSGDGGAATAAQFKHPTAVTIDRGGNMYITDQLNNRIRRVSRTGTVTTVAGTGMAGYSGDGGPATAAALSTPGSVAVDAAGILYVADNVNHRIRRVGADAVITTVVGNGVQSSTGDDGPASAATLNNPFGIAFDPLGNLFIAESGANRIRRVGSVASAVPTFSSNGITNGASFRSGGTPGGAIATIFGVNLSAVNGILQATSTPLPTELGGTSVRLGGILAPLFAVVRVNGQEQINLQIPFDLAQAVASSPRPAQAQQFVEAVITSGSVSNAPVLMQLAPAQPGIFLVDGVNGAILDVNNVLVSAQNPASSGDTVVVYATGLGAVENQPVAGEPASSEVLSPTPVFASATVAGRPAVVTFSGLAPGFVGLYQINLIVPAGASGDADVVITMNGVASNTAKMAVE
jgi:uncharacterized protein (TIGR03437 family)